MHTAICSFDDRATAQRAVDRLLESGFDRRDVHLTHRHADGTRMGDDGRDANDVWDGMEREVAVSRTTLENLGHFFSSLFGKDDAHGHAGTYSRAVERGHYVVVVDAHDEATATRAQNVLHGLEAGDLNVVHRAEQRPLRDMVAERQTMGLHDDVPVNSGLTGMEQSFGTARADMAASHNMDLRREGEMPRERMREEAAMAAGETVRVDNGGMGVRPTGSRDPDDASHAPGLRYSDKDIDKPR